MAGRGRMRDKHADYIEPVCMDGTTFDHCACFGERVRMMTERRGLTIRRLSEMSGINYATLYDYIRKGSLPNIELGYMIAYALKVDPRWLFGYINTKKEARG